MIASYDPPVMLAKLVGESAGIGASAATAIVAAGESLPLTYTALGATLVFTALLVRQLTANQRVYLTILEGKDYELAYNAWQARRDRWDDADRLAEARWEAEVVRWRHGERQTDPGPYVPRPRPADLDQPPQRSGIHQEANP